MYCWSCPASILAFLGLFLLLLWVMASKKEDGADEVWVCGNRDCGEIYDEKTKRNIDLYVAFVKKSLTLNVKISTKGIGLLYLKEQICFGCVRHAWRSMLTPIEGLSLLAAVCLQKWDLDLLKLNPVSPKSQISSKSKPRTWRKLKMIWKLRRRV